jgi:beta-glucosidase-like glycosyl hydrolase
VSSPESLRRELASLLVPCIPWSAEAGFEPARPLVEEALALGVGGVVLTGGEQGAVRTLAKELQRRAPHPLLVGAMLDRGAGQRIVGGTPLPPPAALAALGDVEACRRAARLTAREARTMGINWILGPVGDLAVRDQNPAVATGAFGREPRQVEPFLAGWISACQGEGVLAGARHFPGLGRADTDPLLGPVVIHASSQALKELDLLPFRAAIGAGVASLLVGHASYPALDDSGLPASCSREVVQWLLRQQMRFDQLVVAAPATEAAARQAPGGSPGGDLTPAAVTALAVRAGCDLVLDPGPLDAALAALEAAVEEGSLDRAQLQRSVRRRLKWAQWAAPPNEWRRPSGADTAWGALVSDRAVRVAHGPLPPMGVVTEVVVVDDDEDVPGERPSRQGLVEALRLAGHDARVAEAPTPASGGPLVVALFADAHPAKGRSTLRPDTLARMEALRDAAAAARRALIVVALGDPRFVAQLPTPSPTLECWSGDRGMQQAAARALLRPR